MPKPSYEVMLKLVQRIKPLNAYSSVLCDSDDPGNSLNGNENKIVVAVKENFCTKGQRTSCASNMLKGFKSPYSATVVQKLMDSGAVIIGRTNLDEFGMGSGTIDSIFGPTKNIWRSGLKYRLRGKHKDYSHHIVDGFENDWFIAGGSSGGSAVAVASGTCFGALGSDTGGSARNPAAYCGVVGLKPTYGLLSRHGLIPLVNSMDAPSILTRNVDDNVTMLNIMAGPDIRDSTTVKDYKKEVKLPDQPSVKGMRVGIPKEFHCQGMSMEVVEAWTDVADMLADAGAIVEQISLPHTQYSIACYSILNPCEVASNFARYDGIEYGLRTDENISTEALYASNRSQGFNEVVRGRILAGNYFLLKSNYSEYFEKAMKVRRLIANEYRQVFKNYDVLLTPVTLSDAPLVSEFQKRDHREQSAIQDYCTQPVNMAGVPAVSVPVQLSSRSLPLSIQLIANHFEEEKMLSVAKWIEQQVDFPLLELEL
ncbi:glutamyl-tRNA(Gln) amidotransferase subunit A, mitochondrial-like isoform X2 [Artemia franciscana]|uniref:Glutamyl-tRNA(Gln) amidotransferase subunit A, mitochondrial n=3 Tax=Artemia franciscana TaxID=6661 RepID=A0AA88I681_ARTSF|nr:hypothetical protein QYM36_002591 [Artemia franciscana]